MRAVAGLVLVLVAMFAVALKRRNARRDEAVRSQTGTNLVLQLSQGAMGQYTSDDIVMPR